MPTTSPTDQPDPRSAQQGDLRNHTRPLPSGRPEDLDPGPRTSVHTARKAHGCDRCEGTIRPGQRYVQLVYLHGENGRSEIQREHKSFRDCDAGLAEVETERQQALDAESGTWQPPGPEEPEVDWAALARTTPDLAPGHDDDDLDLPF